MATHDVDDVAMDGTGPDDEELTFEALHDMQPLQFISPYEVTRIVILRSDELDSNASPFLPKDHPAYGDSVQTALAEFEEGHLKDYQVMRPRPDGTVRKYRVGDLLYLPR